jgi:hypothetical protein
MTAHMTAHKTAHTNQAGDGVARVFCEALSRAV